MSVRENYLHVGYPPVEKKRVFWRRRTVGALTDKRYFLSKKF
nr:MAG TPA: hypothetical protein [Caudoviricetes sp.]